MCLIYKHTISLIWRSTYLSRYITSRSTSLTVQSAMTVIISGFDCSLSIVFAILDLFSIRKRCSIPLLRSFQQAGLPCHQDGVHAPHCGMQGFFHPLATAHLSNFLTCYDCSWSSNTLMLKKNNSIVFLPLSIV